MENFLRNLIKSKEEEIRKALKQKLEVQKRVDEEERGFREECVKLKQEIVKSDCEKQVLITKIKEISSFVKEMTVGNETGFLIEKGGKRPDFIEKAMEKIQVEIKVKKKLNEEVSELLQEREVLKQKIRSLKEKQQFFQDTCEDSLQWIKNREKRRVSSSSFRYQSYISPGYKDTRLAASKP